MNCGFVYRIIVNTPLMCYRLL